MQAKSRNSLKTVFPAMRTPIRFLILILILTMLKFSCMFQEAHMFALDAQASMNQ